MGGAGIGLEITEVFVPRYKRPGRLRGEIFGYAGDLTRKIPRKVERVDIPERGRGAVEPGGEYERP